MYAGKGGDADFLVVDCAYSSFREQLLDRLRADYSWLPQALDRPLLGTTLALVRWRFGIDLASAEPRRYAPSLAVPTLFVTTAGDDYIRPAMTRELFDEADVPKRLRVFPLGGHGAALFAQPEAYREEVLKFLRDLADLD